MVRAGEVRSESRSARSVQREDTPRTCSAHVIFNIKMSASSVETSSSGIGASAASSGGAGAAASAPAVAATEPAVLVNKLSFDYGAATGYKPVLKDMSFSLPHGELEVFVLSASSQTARRRRYRPCAKGARVRGVRKPTPQHLSLATAAHMRLVAADSAHSIIPAY